MNGNSSFNTHLPIHEGGNWERWSVVMKNLFGVQDMLEIVQNGYHELGGNATKVQKTVHKELNKKDCKSLFFIQQGVDVGNFEKTSKATKSKEAWDIFEKYHEGDEKLKQIKLQSLRRKFEMMQMEEEKKIPDYISKLINVVNHMKACSETILDQQIVEKIMRNISPRFDFIVVAIQKLKHVKTLKIEEQQSSLEARELLVSERSSEKSIQQDLQVQTVKKDGYDKKKFKKSNDKTKGGNWLNSKGNNKASDKVESSKGGGFGNYQGKKN